jgi:hypothetical protein
MGDGRRAAAVDDIDRKPFRLIFGNHPLDDVFGIAPEVFDLQKRIFFLERFFEGPDDLVDDQRCIPANLALFSSALDQQLLPVGGFHHGNIFDRSRAQRSGGNL